jgi:mRNA degradation ribonuclease J1/J2
MFLFQGGDFGNLVHTGDFRLHPAMIDDGELNPKAMN